MGAFFLGLHILLHCSALEIRKVYQIPQPDCSLRQSDANIGASSLFPPPPSASPHLPALDTAGTQKLWQLLLELGETGGEGGRQRQERGELIKGNMGSNQKLALLADSMTNGQKETKGGQWLGEK